MNYDRRTILIMSVIGLVLIGAIVYLVLHFASLSKRKDDINIVEELEIFEAEDIEIFDNKIEAYEEYMKDSIMQVTQENVTIDIDNLFSRKQKNTEAQEEASNSSIRENKENEQVESAYKPQKEEVKTIIVYKEREPAVTNNEVMQQEPKAAKERRSFYSIDNGDHKEDLRSSTDQISAVIHGQQRVTQGSTVKLRTTKSATIDGIELPANTYIYGVAYLQMERVKVVINSIKVKEKILPKRFTLYDTDGIEGIHIPGLLLNDVTEDVVDDVLSDASVNVPSLGNVPLKSLKKENKENDAIITNNYKVLLKAK